MFRSSLHNTFFAWVRMPQPALPSREHLRDHHFLLAIIAAASLHMLAYKIWEMVPQTQVIDIPVQVLSIKLGDGDASQKVVLYPAEKEVSDGEGEDVLTRLVRAKEAEVVPETRQPDHAPAVKALEKAIVPPKTETPKQIAENKKIKIKEPRKPKKENIRGKFDVRQEGVATAAPVMPVIDVSAPSQEVRMSSMQANLEVESVAGLSPSAGDAKNDITQRYERVIQQWITKFHAYPEEARAEKLEGEGMVRIRIDRQGNIRYYIIGQSTNHPMLDRAAIEMIRRANPVPAVPNGYPGGDLFEFKIPVSFSPNG